MSKDELECYVEETLKFKNVNDAFNDFIYDFTIEELINYLSDEVKEQIIKMSPSYVKRKENYYFNGNFLNLTKEEVNEVIDTIEKGSEKV